jgi:hypothetical protein
MIISSRKFKNCAGATKSGRNLALPLCEKAATKHSFLRHTHFPFTRAFLHIIIFSGNHYTLSWFPRRFSASAAERLGCFFWHTYTTQYSIRGRYKPLLRERNLCLNIHTGETIPPNENMSSSRQNWTLPHSKSAKIFMPSLFSVLFWML